jgi:hypothetical protein
MRMRGLLVYASAEGWILIDFSHASMADALFSFQISILICSRRINRKVLTHMIFTYLHISLVLTQRNTLSAQCYALHFASLDLHLN